MTDAAWQLALQATQPAGNFQRTRLSIWQFLRG